LGPKTFPDEKGIATSVSRSKIAMFTSCQSPKTFPDEKGIATSGFLSPSPCNTIQLGPKTFPDEKGIATVYTVRKTICQRKSGSENLP